MTLRHYAATAACIFNLLTLLTLPASAAEESRPLWLRYPAVSPDGREIAFTYGGQIWRVPAEGGDALPLTSGEFYSTRPVWSPDGQSIAFAAKRHGNLDVFIMPAAGGDIQRLTHHSANDLPYAFSPDGQVIYFASSRLGGVHSVHAGTYLHSDQLYTVPSKGGRTRLVLSTPALEVSAETNGRYLLYENRPIYENEWRQGAVSDGTRDIWLYDFKGANHKRLTDYRGEDRNAVWSPDGTGYYFLSERGGSSNVWYSKLDGTTAAEPITFHKTFPVRFLSVARNGSLVYGYRGEIWRRPAGSKDSKLVPIRMTQSSLSEGQFFTSAKDYANEITVSPNGEDLAIIARGEVFVVSTKSGRTRRITSTPEHEGSVSFGPDGRTLLYTSERDGDRDIYEARIVTEGAQSFLDPGPIEETRVIDTQGDALYPAYAPDGHRIAYFDNRGSIRVFDRQPGTTTTVLPEGRIYSYQDGDLSLAWSPDGRFLTSTSGSIVTATDVLLIDAAGQHEPINVSRSGYADRKPAFTRDGQAIVWQTGRYGLQEADANTAQFDVEIAFLTQEAFDAFKSATQSVAGAVAVSADWQPQAEGLPHRLKRLTPFSSVPLFNALTPDGQSLIVVVLENPARVVGYKVGIRNGSLQQLFAKPLTAAEFSMDSKGENLYSVGPTGIERISLLDGKTGAIPFDPRIAYDPRGEMRYLFTYFWRLTQLKFYEKGMHGVDWDAMRDEYLRFLPYLQTWEDFADVMGEMAGQLNASHMGCYYYPQPRFADQTASLGIIYDDTFDQPGMRIAKVLPGGPSDRASTALKPGAVILAVDGEAIAADRSIHALLNHKEGTPIQLTVRSADGGAVVKETVTPIRFDDALALDYENWIDERKAMTEQLSGGRIGYLHISLMLGGNYRRAYSEIFGELHDKEALIVDVRFNGGGNLHDQLISLFTGDALAAFTSRDGRVVGRMPIHRWAKPSALLANAGSYSDGSIFPHLYQRQGIGPVIGARVPGTGTAVWWIYRLNKQLKYGIPQLGAKDFKTGWFENQETVPDILVFNDPDAIEAGRDPQLEAGVKALLAKLNP
ncbi:MAG: PD40 domain-containing protein [Gammaproteobacteria bacterium]|nr:PD40 domain-containing protein [Gammaproteobacteria bacterium]